MGGDNSVEYEHEEELYRLRNIADKNKRDAEAKELAIKLGHEKDLKEIQRLMDLDIKKFKEAMYDLDIKRENLKALRDNERKKIEGENANNRKALEDKHNEEIRKIDNQRLQDQELHQRKTKEIELNAKNEATKINNEHQAKMKEITDKANLA